MSFLSLAQANLIISAALQKARTEKLPPMTVAVLDAGGHLIALQREDRSGILRSQIAFGKAWGALGMGFGTRTLAQRAQASPGFFTALSSVSDGRMIPVPGGVLVRDSDANVIGAAGMSGGTSEEDELCLIAGVVAAELTPDAGEVL